MPACSGLECGAILCFWNFGCSSAHGIRFWASEAQFRARILPFGVPLGSRFCSFLCALIFSVNPCWYLRFLGVQNAWFFCSGNNVQFCTLAALVVIFPLPRLIANPHWYLRFCGLQNAGMERVFELPKPNSEQEFDLSGCSGKPLGAFSQPENARPPLNLVETKRWGKQDWRDLHIAGRQPENNTETKITDRISGKPIEGWKQYGKQ